MGKNSKKLKPVHFFKRIRLAPYYGEVIYRSPRDGKEKIGYIVHYHSFVAIERMMYHDYGYFLVVPEEVFEEGGYIDVFSRNYTNTRLGNMDALRSVAMSEKVYYKDIIKNI